MATHSSLELREYMAYEKHAGPLGDAWSREKITQTHYLLQWTNYLLGAWVTKEGQKNPVPEPTFDHWKPDLGEDAEPEE